MDVFVHILAVSDSGWSSCLGDTIATAQVSHRCRMGHKGSRRDTALHSSTPPPRCSSRSTAQHNGDGTAQHKGCTSMPTLAVFLRPDGDWHHDGSLLGGTSFKRARTAPAPTTCQVAVSNDTSRRQIQRGGASG